MTAAALCDRGIACLAGIADRAADFGPVAAIPEAMADQIGSVVRFVAWDFEYGRSVLEIEGDGNAVCDVSLAEDCGRVAFGLRDGTVRIWTPNNPQELVLRVRNQSDDPAVEVIRNGDKVRMRSAGGSAGGEDSALDNSEAEIHRLTAFTAQPQDVDWMTFSADGCQIITAAEQGGVCFWRGTDLLLEHEFPWTEEMGQVLALSAGGDQVATAMDDGRIAVWTAQGEKLRELAAPDEDFVNSIRFSHRGGKVFVLTDKRLIAFDVANGAEVFRLRFDHEEPERFAISHDETKLAVAHSEPNWWSGRSIKNKSGFASEPKRKRRSPASCFLPTTDCWPSPRAVSCPSGESTAGESRLVFAGAGN